MNLTAFQEVDQQSWYHKEQAVIDWAAAAFDWITKTRGNRKSWLRFTDLMSRSTDLEACGRCGLTFEELVEGVNSSHRQIQKAEKILADFKGTNEVIEHQLSASNHVVVPPECCLKKMKLGKISLHWMDPSGSQYVCMRFCSSQDSYLLPPTP